MARSRWAGRTRKSDLIKKRQNIKNWTKRSANLQSGILKSGSEAGQVSFREEFVTDRGGERRIGLRWAGFPGNGTSYALARAGFMPLGATWLTPWATRLRPPGWVYGAVNRTACAMGYSLTPSGLGVRRRNRTACAMGYSLTPSGLGVRRRNRTACAMGYSLTPSGLGVRRRNRTACAMGYSLTPCQG